MSLLNVRTWVPHEFDYEGHVISYELKRPNRALARELQVSRMRLALAAAPVVGMTPAQIEELPPEKKLELLSDAGKAVADEALVERIFNQNVNKVDGLSIDGEPATTGAQLYEWAPQSMVNTIIGQLCNLAQLTEAQGKTSASLSTSSAAETAPSGGSSSFPAESTEREASQPPSTATGTSAAA